MVFFLDFIIFLIKIVKRKHDQGFGNDSSSNRGIKAKERKGLSHYHARS
jgi:hypothetical protein